MDSTVKAALIAATVTLLGFFIRDYLIVIIREKKSTRQKKSEIYGRYAEPIARSTESLFWRLDEIIGNKGRAHFLLRHETNTAFEDYKYVSTLYRFAALLGWIQAIRKEQFSLKPVKEEAYSAITEAIANLEHALADGPHIELRRLEALVSLWSIPVPDKDKHDLAVGLETIIKADLSKHKASSAIQLTETQRYGLCEVCRDFLAKELNIPSIEDAVLRETMARATNAISIREAWVYRDWQSAIGDLVLSQTHSGDRQFDVFGFKEFENIYLNPNEEQKRWLDRIESVFRDVDVSTNNINDERLNQLSASLVAISKLVLAIHESDLEVSPFSNATIEKAMAHG